MVLLLISFFLHTACGCICVTGQGSKDGCNTTKGPVIGGPFELIDSHGRLVTEEDLRGDWILLYFGYTSSPDVGPTELLKLAKAINILGYNPSSLSLNRTL